MAAPAAALSRANLQLLLATKKELQQLAIVEQLLADHLAAQAAADSAPPQPPLSLVRGLFVRLKYGEYQLALVGAVAPPSAADGKPQVAVQLPLDAAPGSEQPLACAVPLKGVSGTDSLASDEQWEAAGRAELERLQAYRQQRGLVLPLAEAAAAAWRKRTALLWHSQHVSKPLQEQQAQLAGLLQQLQAAGGPAEMLQWLEPAAEPAPAPRLAGVTVQLPAAAAVHGAQEEATQQQQRQDERLQEQRLTTRSSRGRSTSPPARLEAQQQRSTSPGHGLDLPLVPVLVRRYRLNSPAGEAPISERWELTSQQAFVSGLPSGWSSDQIRRLMEDAGCKVTHCTVKQGQAKRGDFGDLFFDGAHKAAAAMERLQGAVVPAGAGMEGHRRLFLRPIESEVKLCQRDDPAAYAAAQQALEEGWTLTTPEVFVSGIFPGPEADQLRELEALCEGVGASVLSARITRGDMRGDMADITLADARQAATVIERLQGAELRGSKMRLRPTLKSVNKLRERYPHEAAAAEQELAVIVARSAGSGGGAGPPAWPAYPPPPAGQHDGILAPVVIRHFSTRSGLSPREELRLTSNQLFVSGLPQPHDLRGLRVDVAVELRRMIEGAGARVVERVRVKPGDHRGDVAHIVLATAQEAALVIERLQGVEICGRFIFFNTYEASVRQVQEQHPGLADAALERGRRLLQQRRRL